MDQHLIKWINEEIERVRTAATMTDMDMVTREVWGFLRGLCLGKAISVDEYTKAMELCTASALERLQEFFNGSAAA